MNSIPTPLTKAMALLDQRLSQLDPACNITDSTTLGNVDVGLTQATDLCYGLAQASGWWIDTETNEDVRTWPKKFLNLWISAKLMLVVTEVAEAMEGHRKNLPDDKLPHRPMLEVEMADAVIRILDLAGGLELDVAGAIIEKLAYNQSRPDHKLENRTAAGGKSI